MITAWIESLLVLLVITNLLLVSSSRVWRCIQVVTIQGLLLGLLTVLIHIEHLSAHIWALAIGSTLVKSFILPILLYRAVREINVRSTIEPFIGYSTSVAIAILLLSICIWMSHQLPYGTASVSLSIPVALYTLLIGLFVIVSRKKALTQVLGYLVMENGIYALGISLLVEIPLTVDLGILLDLVVAVFLMGITLFHIDRSFDHIDTTYLSTLKDTAP